MQYKLDGTVWFVDLDWEEKALAALKCVRNERSFVMYNFAESVTAIGLNKGVHSADKQL